MARRRATAPPVFPMPRLLLGPSAPARSIADPNVVERAALYLVIAELIDDADRRAPRRRSDA